MGRGRVVEAEEGALLLRFAWSHHVHITHLEWSVWWGEGRAGHHLSEEFGQFVHSVVKSSVVSELKGLVETVETI